MANPWFRMYSEFMHDPKVQMMSEAYQRRFVMLLCSRCCNGDVTLHDAEVAFQLRISADDWQETKAAFVAKGLITDDNKPTAWDKRQYASDSSAERVARHRNNKKQGRNVTETKSNALDTDTDTEVTEDKSSVVASKKTGGDIVSIPNCPQGELLAVFGETLAPLPQPRVWDGARANNMRARWRWVLDDLKARGKPFSQDAGIDYFRRFFGYVAKSDFLMGKTDKWRGCDLSWLVKAENFAKVIEGKYHNEEAAA